jgi:hypothetical protein
MQGTDPSPWFSHQHDANFESDGQSITVFDDGNTRQNSDPAAHSRGQAVMIDEQSRTASLALNADLGGYSYALGSAQLLQNGNYHFNSGAQIGSGPGSFYAQSLEVNPAGALVYGIQFATLEYRSFRMVDLYTAP